MSTKHAQLTVREIRGPYMQLLTNLQGEEGRLWFAALRRFLRKENAWDGKPLFAPWKTVWVGELGSVEEIEQLLREEGFGISEFAKRILHSDRFVLVSKRQEIDLVCVTPRQLGVEGEHGCAPYSAIFQAVKMCGLESCPPEAVIAARRAFPEQEYSGDGCESDLMAVMLPFSFDKGTRFCFELLHGASGDGKAEICLSAYDIDSHEWGLDVLFLCVQPRK